MIWIDITNLPHVLFFRDFIKENETFVTTREFGSLTALLDMNDIEYVIVGRHGGKDPRSKLLESSRRVEELTRIVSTHDVDVAIAKHSVELPRVAFGLDIPSIFILDNEYAEQQNKLTLPLAGDIITPQALNKRVILKQGADSKRIRTFYGVCEATHLNGFTPDRALIEGYKDYVVVRPEPYMAAYFQSEATTQTLIDHLHSRGYTVIVLPRGAERFDNAIHLQSIDAMNLLYHAKAFFGGGGTMNREAAVMGTPAISFYSQELLGVDKFLIKLGLLTHTMKLDIDVEEILSRKGLRQKAEKVRKKLQNPFEVIKEAIP